jgi:glycosyltransferase involved in cell wall biosynthesis
MREVCLVVPCFNEERRLPKDRFREFLGSHADASICFVNDGSADRTLSVLQTLNGFDPNRLLVVNLARNGGKAEAVRQGVLYALSLRRFEFIGYWDADLSTPLTEVDHLIAPLTEDKRYQLALGSRVKRLGSNIDRDATRHYLGRVFSTLSSQLLDLPVYDSQCGAKLFRAEVANILFDEPFSTAWAFDLEILVRLRRRLGTEKFHDSTIEVPLRNWREIGGSKLKFVDMLRMPLELFRIRRRYLGR